MDDENQPKVKGTGFLGIIKFVKEKKDGKKLLQEIFKDLSPDSAALFQRKIISIMEYDYRVFAELLHAVDRKLGRGDLEECRELGRYTAKIDIRTVYYMYKKKASPEDLSRDSDVIWQSYYINCGYMKTEDLSPENTIICIYAFPEMDPAHCRLMEGWMAQAIIETGGSWIEEIREVRCNSKGDDSHEFRGKWKN